MSGTTPPPDPTQPGVGAGPVGPGDSGVEPTRPLPSDTVSFGDSDGAVPPPPPAADVPFGSEPPQRKSHRGVVGAIVVSLALIVGGGAFAFVKADPLHLFNAGPQAAEAIPESAIAYVGLDLDPSAEQKIQAIQFLDHFPAFKENSGVTDENADIRKVFIDKALESSDCDLSYADDFEPWLGTKLGVGVMPPENEGEDPVALVALQVTDSDAATKAIKAVQACKSNTFGTLSELSDSGSGDSGDDATTLGIATVGDYLLMAQTQEEADRYATAADDASLADNSEFKADMDSLGDLGVATGWADVKSLLELANGSSSSDSLAPSELGLLTSQAVRAAATLRFSSDYAEVVATTLGTTPPLDHPDNEIVGLPASTVLAASVSGGGDRLRAQWDDVKLALAADGTDVDQQIQDLENQTGLSIPDDLETLLGDNLLASVDAHGLTPETFAFGGFDMDNLDFGVRFTGDKSDLDNLYQRVLGIIQQQTGSTDVPFSKVDTDKGFAMATNDDYAHTLADLGGTLGDSPDFTSVVPDGAGSSTVVYVDWNLIEESVLGAARQLGGDQEVVDNLKPLRAFGISSTSAGDYNLTTIRLSVDD